MQRLTVAGRLIITALIIGAIYFGFRMFGGQEALKKLAPETQTETNTATSGADNASNPSEQSNGFHKCTFTTPRFTNQHGEGFNVLNIYVFYWT